MYAPSAFVETDLSALDRLFADTPLLSLITVRDDSPTVSHLPMLYLRQGHQVELRGHWARPNPQSGHSGAALAERDEHYRQLRGIVGFRLQVERILLKFKLNQNHPRTNRVAVAGKLEALATDRSRSVAALMRDRLDD